MSADDFGAGILESESLENCDSSSQELERVTPTPAPDGGPSADSTEARGVEQHGSSPGS